MPPISAFYGVTIRMYFADHLPPHFHAFYAENEAVIDIRTLDMLDGNMPRRARDLMLEWAQEHRAELMEDWELCSRKQMREPIPPLP